jgi:hypothetical protein
LNEADHRFFRDIPHKKEFYEHSIIAFKRRANQSDQFNAAPIAACSTAGF